MELVIIQSLHVDLCMLREAALARNSQNVLVRIHEKRALILSDMLRGGVGKCFGKRARPFGVNIVLGIINKVVEIDLGFGDSLAHMFLRIIDKCRSAGSRHGVESMLVNQVQNEESAVVQPIAAVCKESVFVLDFVNGCV